MSHSPDSRRSMHLVLVRVFAMLDRIESIEGWKRNPRLSAIHAELVRDADSIKHRSAVLAMKERAQPAGDGLVTEFATLSGKPTPRGDAAA